MRFKLLLVLFLSISATACAPYKMDIRQGNYVTPETRAQLKPGMTRLQVRALLGTPLVMDPFHPDRWDYVYTLEHRGTEETKQHFTLYFKGDILDHIDDRGMKQENGNP